MSEVAYALDRDTNVATLVIDTAGPVNSIGQAFLADLERAIVRADGDHIKGLIITSGKKKSFLDGANLQEFIAAGTPQMLRIILRRFHDCCEALAKSPFPVTAILDGQSSLGGGFEFLLWTCDHVFAAPGSKIGLPEVNVGLFPAGGGTQTLKKVVGFETAVGMITAGRVEAAENLNREDFLSIRPSEELLSAALDWIESRQGVVNRNYDPDYREPDESTDQEKAEIIKETRARLTVCPYRPAYAAAIDAIEAGLSMSFEEAVANEIDLFVPLFADPNTRNKIDLFFLTTSVAPRLVKVDRRRAAAVNSFAVIGAGLMGQGIAQIAADRGTKVIVVDVNEKASRAAIDKIERTVDGLVTKGRWSKKRKDNLMSNLGWTTDYTDLKDIPLVIECVFEDVPLKQRILADVQEVNPDAIFASNTSTIPMARIAEGAARPEQVVGMHFFSPVPLMPLLEVIQGPQSTVESVATAVTVGRALGKSVILVGDGPGFYTSRTFGTYVMTGLKLAELGVSPWDLDRTAMQVGFPQGPLHVYGTTGGNVVYHAGKLLSEAFPNRLELPDSLPKLHAAGYVGGSSPSFYLDERKLTPDESVMQHMVGLEGFPTPSKEEAQDILLLSMVNEAFWCLSDGVLKDYYSMDLGAVLGIGFPDCRHGPARYVSLRGVKAVKARLEELADRFQMPSLAPAPEFDQLIACGLDSHLI